MDFIFTQIDELGDNMNSPLKWMGGKKKLLPWIGEQVNDYNRIIEPFMGSGSFFFGQEPGNVLCSDIQTEPIAVINAIKNTPEEFFKLFTKYSDLLWDNGETFYYQLRLKYNEEKEQFTNVKRAAIFMTLLRAGFNGLVRFNTKGNWNVPFGDRGWKGSKSMAVKLTNSFPYEKFEEWSKFLNEGNKIFKQQSFKNTISQAVEGDLVYCDPPYLITTQKYNEWNEDLELELFRSLKEASDRGVKFILSNVYLYKGEINKDLLDLYKEFKYKLKEHKYVVGPKREKKVTEIIIYN